MKAGNLLRCVKGAGDHLVLDRQYLCLRATETSFGTIVEVDCCDNCRKIRGGWHADKFEIVQPANSNLQSVDHG